MTAVDRVVNAEPADVWAVLADGWLYALWVVGAVRMREVDDSWPRAGARLHHSVGTWPMLVDDTTSVVEVEPGRRLLLRARAWPAGEAEVELRLDATSGGTAVTMVEDAVSGPAVLIPGPARATMLRWRNDEALRRLALLAENRQRS